MTLSATYEPRRQQGNGITKEFSYSFDPYSPEALKVYIEENGVQSETQDYTATVSENGGIVTFNVAPTSEQYVVITRSVPQDQEVPFYTSSGFDAGVVENSLDKLTAMIQEVGNETLRSAKLPKGYNINLELPVPESGKGLYWNNEGTGFQNSRLNLDDVETLTKSYRDQSLAARDEAVASSTRAVNTVKEATDLLANTQTYVDEAVVTINTAVDDAKATITETSEEAKETINGYVSNAEENVRQIAQEEANKAIEDAAAAATEIATNNIQPLVDEAVSKAEEAINNADDAENSAIASRVWSTGEDAEVEEIAPGEEEHSSRGYADLAMAIANAPEDVPVDASKLMALQVIKGPKGEKGDKGDKGEDGKDGGGLEIGDVAFAVMGIDETKKLRRYLNGQVISQAQFASFSNWVKERAKLYPNTVATEGNWQAEVTNSKLGQCGKFVIDDTLGTIRLPKVVNINGLQDLALMGSIKAESLPNITGSSGYLRGLSKGENDGEGALYFEAYSSADSPSHAGSTGNYSGYIKLDASRSSSTYQDNAPVQQEAILYPYFIQVATGTEESVDVTREIELNNPFSLLDYKWSEYELSNASWLLSNGAFHSGATYVAVYELLLKIKNGTETKEGVSVKLSTEDYADTDFVINTADTTFRLPVKVKLASGNAVVGNGMTLGLTNGNVGVALTNDSYEGTRTFVNTGGYGQSPSTGSYGGSTALGTYGVTTDPTKSGIETSSSGLKLYFYVGETIQDASVIAASQVLTDIANLKNYDYVVESYNDGTNWYRVYKSGWVEQGGETNMGVITYLKAFNNTDYNLQVTPHVNQSAQTYWNDFGYDLTTTGFKLRLDNYKTQWRACGQGA